MVRRAVYLTVSMLAGSMITDAAEDACRLATLLDTPVSFDFNGIDLWANPEGDPDHICGEYLKRLRLEHEQQKAREA